MSDELVVLVTAPNSEEAARIAEALVTDRLAACVNILPAIESIYRWEGKVTRDSESLMIVKTTVARYSDVERRIKEVHSYSTPEIIAVKIDRGSAEYLSWLRDAV